MSDIERYSDKAMFPAVPMASNEPKVVLLNMTPDPLGSVAAFARMYQGKPTLSLADISDDERRYYWGEVQKTELNTPLEAIDMHWFIEGVDRAFTHQLVRQRTAVYAQESLRFAVKDGSLADETSRPPSLNDPSLSYSRRNDRADLWFQGLDTIERVYKALIADGMPAEDARGILPQAILTRVNYKTNLRNFAAEAGKRLCTQAQFHWRSVFLQMREAVRTYTPDWPPESFYVAAESWERSRRWQFELIADSNIFAPVCYQIGHCGFKAEFDRGCTIRDRVDANERQGRSSEMWGVDYYPQHGEEAAIPRIQREEWAQNPKAGWVQ